MKIIIPYGYTLVQYTEEEEYEFKLYAKKPYPILNKGDVVVVETSLLRWIKLRRLPFSEVSPNEAESLFAPNKEAEEGGFTKSIKGLFVNKEKALLDVFYKNPKELKVEELKELCKLRGISGYSRLREDELIELITIDLKIPPKIEIE